MKLTIEHLWKQYRRDLTIAWLRRGSGSGIYLFLFPMAIISASLILTHLSLFDRTGLRLVGEGIRHAAQPVRRMSEEGFILGTVGNLPAPQRFRYGGIDWTTSVAIT